MATNPTLNDVFDAVKKDLANAGDAKPATGDAQPPADKNESPSEDAKPSTEGTVSDAKDDTAGNRSEADRTVEIDASPEEIKNALTFFRGLADPDQRSLLLQTLATQAGFDLTKKSEAKQFVKEVKKTSDILKEYLGNTYDLIEGDKLAAAIDLITDQKSEEKIKPLRDEYQQNQIRENERKAEVAIQDFYSRHKIPHDERKALADQMNKKMEQLPPSGHISADQYLDDIYKLVRVDSSSARSVKNKVTKIENNATDVNTSGKGGVDERIVRMKRLPTLDESIRAAAEGRTLEFEE